MFDQPFLLSDLHLWSRAPLSWKIPTSVVTNSILLCEPWLITSSRWCFCTCVFFSHPKWIYLWMCCMCVSDVFTYIFDLCVLYECAGVCLGVCLSVDFRTWSHLVTQCPQGRAGMQSRKSPLRLSFSFSPFRFYLRGSHPVYVLLQDKTYSAFFTSDAPFVIKWVKQPPSSLV